VDLALKLLERNPYASRFCEDGNTRRRVARGSARWNAPL
jgi:hypothetical protein